MLWKSVRNWQQRRNIDLSKFVSSSSLLCLVFLSLAAILWPFGLVLQRLILELDTYMGIDRLKVFPLFVKMIADIIAPKLSIIFHWLIRRI